MSLRITPAPTHPAQTTPSLGAPSAPGVHDTLRANLSLTTLAPKSQTTTTTQPTSFHPLESRLSNWRAQQESLKMNLLRRQFGLAEPVKRAMELQIVGAGEWAPRCLGLGGGAHVHEEILAGRDAEIAWEDVFTGEEGRDEVDFHGEMERRFGMVW
ncbi:proteasome maturation factor UMP1 [Teratosphaeria nubilosa]|uniref:Proteasome maturation factor UMP1 n=1 Tax=Teratosphaeria nubilosa TaxID=161662 RepID=A0A6G1KTQ5_9PEZI|nr:proteasome maturation factor UMP1 [Teratosphaeria nubilosa]